MGFLLDATPQIGMERWAGAGSPGKLALDHPGSNDGPGEPERRSVRRTGHDPQPFRSSHHRHRRLRAGHHARTGRRQHVGADPAPAGPGSRCADRRLATRRLRLVRRRAAPTQSGRQGVRRAVGLRRRYRRSAPSRCPAAVGRLTPPHPPPPPERRRPERSRSPPVPPRRPATPAPTRTRPAWTSRTWSRPTAGGSSRSPAGCCTWSTRSPGNRPGGWNCSHRTTPGDGARAACCCTATGPWCWSGTVGAADGGCRKWPARRSRPTPCHRRRIRSTGHG